MSGFYQKLAILIIIFGQFHGQTSCVALCSVTEQSNRQCRLQALTRGGHFADTDIRTVLVSFKCCSTVHTLQDTVISK